MAEFPALPLFTDSLIADCNHLTDAEMGLYLRILMLIWRNPGCRIPNDLIWISRKLSRPKELFEPLLKEFCNSDGNFITQKRLSKEFSYIKTLSKRGSDNAKSRWNKEKDICKTDAGLHTSSNAPIPIPIPIKEKIYKKEISGFEDFYKIFPSQRKGNREKVEAAYRQALTRTAPEEIMTGLKSYLDSDEVNNGYAKGAAAWLNDDRWKINYTIKPSALTSCAPVTRNKVVL